MPVSKGRKKKKITKQVDGSGKIANSRTKKHINNVRRLSMVRGMLFQEASNSLTAAELKGILDKAIERRDSTATVKGPKPTMSYIETKLDDKGVPTQGETKEISISNADINRLQRVLEMKENSERQLKEQVKEQETKT